MAATARTDGNTRTVTATEARVHFGEMLRIVREQGGTVIVERPGSPRPPSSPSTTFESFSGSGPIRRSGVGPTR